MGHTAHNDGGACRAPGHPGFTDAHNPDHARAKHRLLLPAIRCPKDFCPGDNRAHITNPRGYRMRSQRSQQGGFTLIEILVAIAIIVVLGTVIFFHFNMAKSKGEALVTAMQGIGSAATRFDADTSCMPTNTGELFNVNLAGTNNYCGIDVTSSWNGPYMEDRPLDANNNVLLTSIAPTTSLKIVEGAFLNDGNSTQYAVEANNVPNAIAAQAYKACGGAQSQCVMASANSAGQGMTSIDYVFDES